MRIALTAIAALVLCAVCVGASHAQQAQQAPSELDIRVGAMTQEYEGHLLQATRRAAALAAELAATQVKLKEALEKCADACKAKEK